MPVFIKLTRNTQKIRVIACVIVTAALAIAAVLCWMNPQAREVAFPVVLFFAAIYAYRLYLCSRLLRQKLEGSY